MIVVKSSDEKEERRRERGKEETNNVLRKKAGETGGRLYHPTRASVRFPDCRMLLERAPCMGRPGNEVHSNKGGCRWPVLF